MENKVLKTENKNNKVYFKDIENQLEKLRMRFKFIESADIKKN